MIKYRFIRRDLNSTFYKLFRKFARRCYLLDSSLRNLKLYKRVYAFSSGSFFGIKISNYISVSTYNNEHLIFFIFLFFNEIKMYVRITICKSNKCLERLIIIHTLKNYIFANYYCKKIFRLLFIF